LQQHGIKLYPFDSEELDAEEIQLNERIRVRLLLSPSHTNDG
jgi:hypothetical protein